MVAREERAKRETTETQLGRSQRAAGFSNLGGRNFVIRPPADRAGSCSFPPTLTGRDIFRNLRGLRVFE